MIRSFLFFVVAATVAAQGWPATAGGMGFQAARNVNRDDPDYQNGMRELDQRHWDRAISDFKASAAHKRSSSDAALYWQAYAENRAGRDEDAMATLSSLLATYPSSSWLKDARALQMEVQGQTGATPSPNAQPDEELKLLAINSLMQSDPNQAVPILQKLLKGDASEKLKERALFVLTQSSSPEARTTLDQLARDSSNPTLQRKAIHYMGLMGNAQARNELASIYKSSSDVQLKRDILHSFMQSGSRDFLLDVAKSEQNPELRLEAIHQLAISGGQEQLEQLYRSESSMDNKKAIVKSMFMTGDTAFLEQIVRSEKDPELRITAIKSLGMIGGKAHTDFLTGVYESDQTPEVRHAILNALFMQQNGKALVELARSEKDPKWKQEIVQKMSLVHSKEVTDYMVEVLK